jgi:hypothetical protein
MVEEIWAHLFSSGSCILRMTVGADNFFREKRNRRATDCYTEGMSRTDLKSLQSAHRKLAVLVLHDPVYLPIFERIEKEIALLSDQDDAISRARAVAALQKQVG